MIPNGKSSHVEYESSESISLPSKHKRIEAKGEGMAKAVLVKMMTNVNINEEFLVSVTFDF